jgi:hypothetical protein
VTTAFDTAWQKLAASLGAKEEKEIQELRTKLAECIVISALDVSEDDLADEGLKCLHESHFMNHDVQVARKRVRIRLRARRAFFESVAVLDDDRGNAAFEEIGCLHSSVGRL